MDKMKIANVMAEAVEKKSKKPAAKPKAKEPSAKVCSECGAAKKA